MTDARDRNHRPGMRRRSEFAPADLLRGVERDRARFMRHLLIDPSTWDIARTLQREMEGEDGEGLRGIFVPDEGPHGRLYWWPAHQAAHHQGRLLLGVDADRTANAVLEVEANVARNGTIYLAWNGLFGGQGIDHSPRFLAHPSIGELIDGSLTRRGRQIVLTENGIRLVVAPETEESVAMRKQERRTGGWSAIAARIERWTRCRKNVDADGSIVPVVGALRPFRLFVAEHAAADGWKPPVPQMTVGDDRSISLRWQGKGSAMTITFKNESVIMRRNENGTVIETKPEAARTKRQLRLGSAGTPFLERYRSHEDKPHE